MILLAAVFIIAMAARKWVSGIELAHLGGDILFTLGASLVNAGLGWYLIRTGSQSRATAGAAENQRRNMPRAAFGRKRIY